MYAKIINAEKKICQVGFGINTDFYRKIGMTEMEVEQAYNGEWYVKGYAPKPPQDELNAQEAAKMKSILEKMATNAMMATLAGSDISAQQTEYQFNIAVLSDDVALLIPEVYPVWSGNGVEYKKDMRVTYNSVLYKVLQDHTSQETWTPTDAPSLFAKVLTSTETIPDWEQPTAENAYMKGDKVRYNGKVYESLIGNNVWKPDEYPAGWKEVTKTITIL